MQKSENMSTKLHRRPGEEVIFKKRSGKFTVQTSNKGQSQKGDTYLRVITLFFIDQKSIPCFFLSELGLKERKTVIVPSEVNSQHHFKAK